MGWWVWVVGGALLSYVFRKTVQNCKATAKPLQRKLQSFQTLLSQCFSLFFVFSFAAFAVIDIYIEKTKFLPAKIVPSGV